MVKVDRTSMEYMRDPTKILFSNEEKKQTTTQLILKALRNPQICKQCNKLLLHFTRCISAYFRTQNINRNKETKQSNPPKKKQIPKWKNRELQKPLNMALPEKSGFKFAWEIEADCHPSLQMFELRFLRRDNYLHLTLSYLFKEEKK